MMLQHELAKRSNGKIEFRDESFRLRWTIRDLPTSDAHVVAARIACGARIANSPADRQLFAERFLTDSEITTCENVEQLLLPALRSTLQTLARSRSAADAICADWSDEIRRAIHSAAFAGGIEAIAPFEIHVESATLQAQALREAAAARKLQEARDATSLLVEFEKLRKAAPDLPAGQLLNQIATSDPAATLQALLLASSESAAPQSLFAVAGNSLLKIDPRGESPRIESIELSNKLGPLRSVQSSRIGDQNLLLIGAQRGVIACDFDNPREQKLFPAQINANNQHGFNRVVFLRGKIWASHSEVGIVNWSLDDENSYAKIEENGSRFLQVVEGDSLAYVAADQVVIRIRDGVNILQNQTNSPVVAILPLNRICVVVYHEGQMRSFDPAEPKSFIDCRARGANLTAALAMPWLNDSRILLAGESGAVSCVGWDDAWISEFSSAHRAYKMLAACADLVAAVTDDRERIVFWRSWAGQEPLAEIYVPPHARHRVSSIVFA